MQVISTFVLLCSLKMTKFWFVCILKNWKEKYNKVMRKKKKEELILN